VVQVHCTNPRKPLRFEGLVTKRGWASWSTLLGVKGVPLEPALLLACAWLATLGACGRTSPLLEDTYGVGASGDDDVGAGATGGASGGRGGSSTSTGGTTRGGTSTGGSSTGGTNRGGSSAGGSSATGGISNTGGTLIDDGGTSFVGGSAGSRSVGGTGNTGGTGADGGTGNTGGTGAMGGIPATGGSAGMGGTMTMPPGGIVCGDQICDPDASVCCQVRSAGWTCQTPGDDCQGATLECSGPGTCDPGEVCCFHRRHSACQSTCNVGEGSQGDPPTIILCDSTADCGPGQTCVASPRGVAYCGDNL
jgi:hypothetical protein